ncbi:uncharacterized protein C16orf78 homolog [Phyllostomus discolor]|uniref:Uncharacterized protein C16orf78 homolog n=1 Tax=Phyllostomus discolor TaxID=89673 RepID=A0A7E6CTQ9_9CHIR|nr:uncharacterized protein C16orf78 homolog [Phyllostomus discolor]
MPPSDPRSPAGPSTSEKPEDLRDMLPTERKSMWRTAEERRMSDLTRVVEWLERRQGKKDQAAQVRAARRTDATPLPGGGPKHTPAAPARKVKVKEERKPRPTQKQNKQSRQVSFSEKQAEPKPKPSSRKDRDAVSYRRLYGLEAKGKRLSMVPGNYIKDSPRKSDLELRDLAAQDSSQRAGPFSRQSLADSVFQDQTFVGRRSTLLRDWIGKMPEAASYDRRLKSLIDKGSESKADIMRILKPEEVLSCRYLRLSPNNIRTLVKLCKDAGMAVDIHPHMVEAEIDAKKVFSQSSMVAL